MPTTLLAVDDSVTMRKVLEITFAGEDFRVVTAEGADAALAKLKSERPAVVLADVTLDGTTGYQLCQRIKAESPGTVVIVLASKQQPYDAAKGSAARADDFMEKPFDTQQLIDKVKKAMAAKPTGMASARPAPPAPTPQAPAAHPVAPAPRPTSLGAGVPRPGAPAAPASIRHTPAAAPADSHRGGTGTLVYPQKAPPSARPDVVGAPTPVTGVPLTPAAHAPPAPVAAAAAAVAAPINGQLAGKLAGLGLNDAQIQGVLALSREVIERVVWEVVPVLAETMIKEEIARLTAE